MAVPEALVACWAMADLAVMAGTVLMAMRRLQAAMAASAVPVARESMVAWAVPEEMAATAARPMALPGPMQPNSMLLKMAATGLMARTAV
jgi:hypothetical protein